MNNVRIYVDSEGINLINYLIYNNIYYEDLICNKNGYILTVNIDDYKKISRRYKCEIIRYYGKNYFINFLTVNKYLLISFIIGLFLLHLLTSTIFKININTSDVSLKKVINEALIDNGIEMYKKKKSFDELLNIKEKILNENRDVLEWIEISEKGCTYNIDVTKRVKKERNGEEKTLNDVIAGKDGKILSIVVENGVKAKDINDYVKKGDILISGNVVKNEDTVYLTNAKGKVYAEVWNTVNITIPFNYIEYVNTGRKVNHYYLDMFNHEFTLIGKYNNPNVIKTKSIILDKPYLPFKLYKEEMKIYKYKEFNISVDEAYNEAIKRSEEKIKQTLNDDEYIISKKVLKKEVFSSKIKLEIFFKIYQNIGMNKEIEEKE